MPINDQPANDRRGFIKKSGLLLSATIVPFGSYAYEKKPKFKMGLQLFTIRDAMDLRL